MLDFEFLIMPDAYRAGSAGLRGSLAVGVCYFALFDDCCRLAKMLRHRH